MIEDVSLHNLKRQGNSPLFLWSCVFRHVKVSGKISGVKINRWVTVGTGGSELQGAWDACVKKFYEGTDWALDISEAKFAGGISFEAIPGDKIKRDQETQVMVSRDNLVRSDWRSFNYGSTGFDIALSWFLEDSLFESVVLAARMASKSAKSDIEVLDMLRKEGIAA